MWADVDTRTRERLLGRLRDVASGMRAEVAEYRDRAAASRVSIEKARLGLLQCPGLEEEAAALDQAILLLEACGPAPKDRGAGLHPKLRWNDSKNHAECALCYREVELEAWDEWRAAGNLPAPDAPPDATFYVEDGDRRWSVRVPPHATAAELNAAFRREGCDHVVIARGGGVALQHTAPAGSRVATDFSGQGGDDGER